MIYAAADLHGNLVDPPADATGIILCGDICPDFIRETYSSVVKIDTGEARQANWLNAEFRDWLNNLSLPCVAIWGNHDFVGEHPHLVPNLPWTLLQDNETLFETGEDEPLVIWGTPWVPGLPYWAFYADERALTLRADAIPTHLDVLLTHGPPLRAGDYIPTSEKQRNKYGNHGGQNVGDACLAAAIKRKQPKVTLCGHIHEARGKHFCHGQRVYNVAAVDGQYKPYDEPWTKLVI